MKIRLHPNTPELKKYVRVDYAYLVKSILCNVIKHINGLGIL